MKSFHKPTHQGGIAARKAISWCLRTIIAGLSSEARTGPHQRPHYLPKFGPDCTVALAGRDDFYGVILDYRNVQGPAGWLTSELI